MNAKKYSKTHADIQELIYKQIEKLMTPSECAEKTARELAEKIINLLSCHEKK